MRLSQHLDYYWDRFADFKDLRIVMAWESKYAILPYTVNPTVKKEVEPFDFSEEV